jgi:AbiU2
MIQRTAVEVKADNIEKMGHPLGAQYSALWQEVANIHLNWGEFVELYGTKPERLELINRAAGTFFGVVQRSLWEGTLLHLARLTDPSKSPGKDRFNLTIQNFPYLIDDEKTKQQVRGLVKAAIDKTEFCRDWRNRHIAHRDLKLALDEPATPLAQADKSKVDAALKAIVEVMNAVDIYFTGSETGYGIWSPHNGVVGLLYVIDDGLKAEEQRMERLRNSRPTEDEFKTRDL